MTGRTGDGLTRCVIALTEGPRDLRAAGNRHADAKGAGEEQDGSGIAHRGRQLGEAHVVHSALDDRVLDAQQLGDPGPQRTSLLRMAAAGSGGCRAFPTGIPMLSTGPQPAAGGHPGRPPPMAGTGARPARTGRLGSWSAAPGRGRPTGGSAAGELNPHATGARMSDLIGYDLDDGVATLTLNRPDERNTLTAPMVAEITAAMDDIEAEYILDAIDFINGLRLEHQARQLQAGEKPDNHLAPKELSPLVRQNLKSAFSQVRISQAALLNRFHLA